MKDQDKADAMYVFPKHIRTYLIFNLSLAVLMAVVIAVRTELRTGRFLVIDLLLLALSWTVLSSIVFGPFAVVEIYLYRRKKGVWYEWKNRTGHRRREREISSEERRYWKSEAYRARLSHGGQTRGDDRKRSRLFPDTNLADGVSRAALLMTVADNFDQSSKKEAAERYYQQIIQQFADSPQAQEAGRRLSSVTKI
jgi:hypothetical protein